MKRLSSIDGLRGIVVVLMIMHHSFDAWVVDPERHGWLWQSLRTLGGLPAPGFMLLAGVSIALVAGRERDQRLSSARRARLGLRRGLYLLGIAFAFRVVMFIVDQNHWDDWPIIFRVDILNCMGVSLAIVAVACAFAPSRRASIGVALALAAIAFLVSPLVYGHHNEFISPFVGNYISGTGWLVLFPLFPWLGFTAVGLALGEYLCSALAAGGRPPNALVADAMWPLLAVGLCVFCGGLWLGLMPFHLYPPHDYTNASPISMSMRVALQLILLALLSIWWRNDAEGRRGGLLQLLGRHSLFVYLFHLEFIYGRLAYHLQHQLPLGEAALGFAGLTVAFTAASRGLELWKGRRRIPRAVPALATVPETLTTDAPAVRQS